MTTHQIAETYINGNHSEVRRELLKTAGKFNAIKKAFDIAEHLRGCYGQAEYLAFRAWIANQL